MLEVILTNNYIGDSRPAIFLMLDFVFPVISLSEQVHNCFIILVEREVVMRQVQTALEGIWTHNFKELTFHPIRPAFLLELLGDLENVANGTRYHSSRFLSLELLAIRQVSSRTVQTITNRTPFHRKRLSRPKSDR